MATYNVYFVTYYDEEAKRVLNEISNMGLTIVKCIRSSILKEFYYLVVSGGEGFENEIERKIREITGCWVKVERVR